MSVADSRWVPAFAAFEALRKQYEASSYYDDKEVCWKAANEALLRRLQSGQLPARAASVWEEWDDAFQNEPPPEPILDADNMILVPTSFWRGFGAAKPVHREWDWLAGDFEFKVIAADGSRGWGNNGEGMAIGLEVDASHFPHLSWPLANSGRDTQAAQSTGQRGGGRPAANWWPDFTEELAVYIHENGIPDGQGHDGQSSLIDAVSARLVERGKTEPGRGTVQPVVNAVLRRIRLAGN